MNDNERGLYSKYQVLKDGKLLDGDCFVLRPDRDPAAVAALCAYAGATKNDALARDIISWIGVPEPLTLEQLRKMEGEPVWTVGRESHFEEWSLVNVNDAYVVNSSSCVGGFNSYGKTWLAYAHKPTRPESEGGEG